MCVGQRCAALRRLADTEGTFEDLRSAIRDTPGGVLVAADCVGACHLASVALVARRDGATGGSGSTLWLSGMEQRPRVCTLRDWITDGGPTDLARPQADLPGDLADAFVALGPATGPPRAARRR